MALICTVVGLSVHPSPDNYCARVIIFGPSAYQKMWIDSMVLSRFARSWLEHHVLHDSRNWDTTMSGLLSIVIISALGCRAGGGASPRRYHGLEFLKSPWKSLQLRVSYAILSANSKRTYSQTPPPFGNNHWIRMWKATAFQGPE